MNNTPLVIYHGDGCRDGFCAAWVAWQTKTLRGAEFLAMSHGEQPPDVTERKVFILDFSFPAPVLHAMCEQAESLVLIDHHKTAQASLADFFHPRATIVFDMERSGAGLTWDYFIPARAKERPLFVDYVEDRDLWRYKLPGSRLVNAYIGSLPLNFAEWSMIERGLKNWTDLLPLGRAVQNKIDRYVDAMVKHARRVDFDGFNVPIVNASPIDISELLEALAKGEPFAVGWWQRADGLYIHSLRAQGDVDVSAIAKHYGGGGHAKAAGFQSSRVIGDK